MKSSPGPRIGMLFYTILAVAALSLVFTFSASAADPVPAAGAPAPKFQLPSEDGTPISLDQYKGKWVVLYFYPKDFTSGCTVEAHNFQRDLDKYKALNAVILGVSVDSADSHKQFCAKEGLNFKLLADEKHEVTDKYGSTMTYGDKTLAARNTFIIGPDGSIKKVYTGVKPSTHSEEVLAALNDLGAKK